MGQITRFWDQIAHFMGCAYAPEIDFKAPERLLTALSRIEQYHGIGFII